MSSSRFLDETLINRLICYDSWIPLNSSCLEPEVRWRASGGGLTPQRALSHFWGTEAQGIFSFFKKRDLRTLTEAFTISWKLRLHTWTKCSHFEKSHFTEHSPSQAKVEPWIFECWHLAIFHFLLKQCLHFCAKVSPSQFLGWLFFHQRSLSFKLLMFLLMPLCLSKVFEFWAPYIFMGAYFFIGGL
jgi:hypothetical protein